MGNVRIHPEALLFAGLLFNEKVSHDFMFEVLHREFGKSLLESERFPFIETDYYSSEMGSTLTRVYVAFDRLIHPDQLPEMKLKSNRIECDVFSTDGKRNVNIDPGYLTRAKVVLATTKDYRHRLYMGYGVYAEVTLQFSKKEQSYVPWEWTYKDYRRKEAIQFFNSLRIVYRESQI